MKKIIILLLVVLSLMGCGPEKETIEIKSSVTLNSTKADMSNYVLFKESDHVFELVGVKESSRIYDEKGSAILYYGYPQCPFCNRILDSLNDAAKDLGVIVYYVDIYDETATEEDINGLFEDLDPILMKDENGLPIFYVPEVVVVKDGEIIDHHLSVVDSYSDVSKELTKEQYEELKGIYKSLIKRLQ
ncbi:MAG: hypothetical protein WBH68_07630 [Erysipelotrichaceae bacterium]|jgi:thioredoxin-related protein|nr:hypothetical protein [Bacillota bacterium]